MVNFFRIRSAGNVRFMKFDAKVQHIQSFSMLGIDALIKQSVEIDKVEF